MSYRTIAMVYTGVGVGLLENVEKEVRDLIPDFNCMVLGDKTMLQEAIDQQTVTENVRRKMFNMYMTAVNNGADIIYNICSSVGDVAEAAKAPLAYLGVPLVRIDEAMAAEAVKIGAKIGVMATLHSTMNPTKNLIQKKAGEIGKKIEITGIVVESAFSSTGKSTSDQLLEAAISLADKVDVIVLAQGSMAPAESDLAKATKKTVLSSPRFGAAALKEAFDEVMKIKNK